MNTFSVKNFEKFQQYKDRAPPWIKLYNELTDDYAFCQLSDTAKAHLVLIWLLASRTSNRLPCDPDWIAKKISAQSPVDLDELFEAGFIEISDGEQQDRAADCGSRYISKQVKEEVWERDGGKCTACPSTKLIEYDHVIPVSAGGSSNADNVKLLCRSCNRKKRVRSTRYADAESAGHKVATQTRECVEPRGEGEGEGETEKRQKRAREIEREFHETLWPGYPHKVGKADALRAFLTARKSAPLDEIMAGVQRYVETKPDDRNWCNPATFLRQQRWLDEPAPAPVPNGQSPPQPKGEEDWRKAVREVENAEQN